MTAALLCLIMAGTGVAEPENLVTNPAFRSGFLTPTDWSFNSAEDNRVDWQSGDVPGERAVLLQGSGADWAGLTSRRFAVSPGEQIAVVALMRTLDGAAGSQAASAGAEALVKAMRGHPLGADSVIIGHVVDDPHRFVQMTTCFGGGRIVDWLAGEQLPRIC